MNLLDRSVSSFVASSSLTSFAHHRDGDRKGTKKLLFFCFCLASRSGSARGGWRLYVKLSRGPSRAVPLNRICQWGTIWWRERPGEEVRKPPHVPGGPASEREKEIRGKRGERGREQTELPNVRARARLGSLHLSYADCSEQLDFNAGINPLPLNFILEQNAFPAFSAHSGSSLSSVRLCFCTRALALRRAIFLFLFFVFLCLSSAR